MTIAILTTAVIGLLFLFGRRNRTAVGEFDQQKRTAEKKKREAKFLSKLTNFPSSAATFSLADFHAAVADVRERKRFYRQDPLEVMRELASDKWGLVGVNLVRRDTRHEFIAISQPQRPMLMQTMDGRYIPSIVRPEIEYVDLWPARIYGLGTVRMGYSKTAGDVYWSMI